MYVRNKLYELIEQNKHTYKFIEQTFTEDEQNILKSEQIST
jgi:hypothetical protein